MFSFRYAPDFPGYLNKKMENKTPFVNLKRRDPSVASNELRLTHISLIHLSMVSFRYAPDFPGYLNL